MRFNRDGTRLVVGLKDGQIFKIDLMFDSEGAKTESKYDEYEEYHEYNENNQGAKKVGKLAKLFRRLKN